MASVAARAKRRAEAQQRLQHVAVTLCGRFGIEAGDLSARRRSPDPELLYIEQTERIADLLDRIDLAILEGAKASTTTRGQKRGPKQSEERATHADPLGAVLKAAADRHVDAEASGSDPATAEPAAGESSDSR